MPAKPAALACCLLSALTVPVAAGERLSGPLVAEVAAVVDGDTARMRVRIWLGQEVETLVRIRGVDAPELRSRCAAERTEALRAAEALARTLTPRVRLTEIEGDKYSGRVLADVTTEDGRPVAAAILASGLVRAYAGGRRAPWCETG